GPRTSVGCRSAVRSRSRRPTADALRLVERLRGSLRSPAGGGVVAQPRLLHALMFDGDIWRLPAICQSSRRGGDPTIVDLRRRRAGAGANRAPNTSAATRSAAVTAWA